MASPCTNDPNEVISAVAGIQTAEENFERELDDAVDTATENADKFSAFVNGTDTQTVQLGEGAATPTIRNTVRQMMSAATTLDSADVSGKSTTANNGGTALRTLAARFGDWTNIRDFGAKGDGETDDSSAISAYNAFLSSNQNNPSLFNKGFYKSSDGSLFTGPTSVLDNIAINGIAKAHKQKIDIDHYLYDIPTFTTDALNGAACDDSYLYAIYTSDSNNTNQYVERIDLSSGYIDYLDDNHTQLAVVAHSDLTHANGATCDSNYIYVIPGDSNNQVIYKLSKSTLQTVASFDISSLNIRPAGIAYNKEDGLFYISSYEYQNKIFVFDSTFNKVTEINIPDFSSLYGLSLQGGCFLDGDMYFFAFCDNPANGAEYYNYIIKFDFKGGVYQAWLLDIFREAENITPCNGKLLVGVNSSYGERYDYYLCDVKCDSVRKNTENTLSCKRIDDYGGSLAWGKSLYVQKRDTRLGSHCKFVGTGSSLDPFTNISSAIKAVKQLSRNNDYSLVRIYIKSDFNEESLILSNINIPISFEASESHKIGPIEIENCKSVNLINSNVKVELNNTNVGLIGDIKFGISISNSNVILGTEISNVSSETGTTYGVFIFRNGYVCGQGTITIKGFSRGLYTFGGCFNSSGAYVNFSGCTNDYYLAQTSFFTTDASDCEKAVSSYNAQYANAFSLLGCKQLETIYDTEHYSSIAVDTAVVSIGTREVVDGSVKTGANIVLRQANTGNPGNFVLNAQKFSGNSYVTKSLTGTPDGSLTWNGQTIQTSSDERVKTQLESIPEDVLTAWGDVNWGQFQFLDAVAEKGKSARLHLGLVAQAVNRVFESHNLDACKYGILCHEEKDAVDEDITVVDKPEAINEIGEVVEPAVTHIERKHEDAVDLWTVRYEEALAMECVYLRSRISKMQEQIDTLVERVNQLTNNSKQ